MTKRADEIARQAGFVKAGEAVTCNKPTDGGKAFGVDVVTEPTMPKGFFALRTDKGAMVCGPKGSFWVPFFPPYAKEPTP